MFNKNKKTRLKSVGKQRAKVNYSHLKDPLEFYIREEAASYSQNKPFTIYYDNSLFFVEKDLL